MRQRPFTRRLFSALFAMWFSLLQAEPVVLHACPMHDGREQKSAAPYRAPSDEAAHALPAHHAMHHGPSTESLAATEAPASDDGGTHECQCFDCCSGTPAFVLPDFQSPSLQAPVAAIPTRRIEAVATLQSPTRFAHLLPFASGPPQRAPLTF